MRGLVALFLLSLSTLASADYYWYSTLYPSVHYASASAGCTARAQQYTQQNGYNYVSSGIYSITTNSPIQAQCYFVHQPTPGGPTYTVNNVSALIIYRSGTPCAAPKTYNPQTGACDAPTAPNGEVCGPKDVTGLPQIKNSSGQCVSFVMADKASQCKYAENNVREVTTTVQFDSNGVPSGPPTLDVQGCVAVPVGPSPYKSCKQSAPRKACSNGVCVEMQSTAAQCSVAVQFTGEAGDGEFGFTGDPSGGQGPCDPDIDCTPETPPVVTDSQPCSYYADGEGMVSCQSFDYKGVPGESTNCGSFNGADWNCNYKKVPSSNGVQIDTKVESKPNPDGTTTTTKTDVRTEVKCSGAGSCSSTTTKTTNVTIKDGNGNTVSSETACKGSKCGTGSAGDGSGTGEGTCIVDCEESEGPAGPSRSLEQGEPGSFAEGLSEWDQRIADARAELDQKLGEYSALFKGVFDLNLNDSSGSLPCQVFSISTGGATLRICPADYSDQLSYLRYVLLLAAAALAAIIVLRG